MTVWDTLPGLAPPAAGCPCGGCGGPCRAGDGQPGGARVLGAQPGAQSCGRWACPNRGRWAHLPGRRPALGPMARAFGTCFPNPSVCTLDLETVRVFPPSFQPTGLSCPSSPVLASESLCPSDPTSSSSALDVSTEPSEGLSPVLVHPGCPGPHVPRGGAGMGVHF